VKKARGKSKAEVKKMEHELRAKQQAELHALDRELAALRPKRVPKPPTPKANDSDDDGETGSSDDDEKGPTPDVRLVIACARASRVSCRVSCACAILPLLLVWRSSRVVPCAGWRAAEGSEEAQQSRAP
jgi:hypothetical protein